VNGPGEARGADIGIAGGNGVGILIKKGQIIRKVKEEQLADALIEEIQKMAASGEVEDISPGAEDLLTILPKE